MSEILAIKNITKTYEMLDKTIYALKDVSLSVQKGEMLVIMGSSGSGKTTLLHILGALDKPDSGKIYLNQCYEKDYCNEPKATEIRRDYIGFIYQDFNLLNDFTVEENIAMPLILANGRNIQQRVEREVELVGLKGRENHRPEELSGGQQQRVAIARALISNPRILLADEPTGNLDYNTSIEIMEFLKKNKEEKGQTTVIVTHDAKVATFADRILFFKDGVIRDEYAGKEEEEKRLDIILTKFRGLIN